jgi:hypothetical protein
MTAAELLTDLERLGVRLEAHGERLRFFPQSAVTGDLLAALKQHKGDVLKLLTAPAAKPTIGKANSRTAYRLVGCGFPAKRVAPVDPRVLASPRISCPSCGTGRVLPELAKVTRGLCYPCGSGHATQ